MKKLLCILERLSQPVLKEFAFFLFCLFFMGGYEAFTALAAEQPVKFLIAFGFIAIYSYLLTCLASLSRWIKRGGYLFLCLLYIVRYFLAIAYETELSPNVLMLVLETTGSESAEFLNTMVFVPSTLTLCAFCILKFIPFFVLEFFQPKIKSFLWQRVRMCVGGVLSALMAFGLMASSEFHLLFQQDSLDGVANIRSKTYLHDTLSQIVFSAYHLHIASHELGKLIVSTQGALDSCRQVDRTDSLSVVLVIGESHIKRHSSLYGYRLLTMPKMDEEKANGNLFVFTDAITPYPLTRYVLKNMLCCNSVSDSEPWYSKPYFMALFKKCGFRVYLWDNQRDYLPNEALTFSLNALMYNPAVCDMSYTAVNEVGKKYDEELVQSFLDSDGRDENRSPSLVVFHLMGQHVKTSERFPDSAAFKKFQVSDYKERQESWLTDAKRQAIADYDNATFHTDYVLYKIIEHYRNQNAVVVYLSDHGDEVYDYRDNLGRKLDGGITQAYAQSVFEIPFFIWCSDVYKQRNPELIKRMEKALDRPFMSDNLCHVLFDVSCLATKEYKAERDVLSPKYIAEPRLLNDNVFYETIMRK